MVSGNEDPSVHTCACSAQLWCSSVCPLPALGFLGGICYCQRIWVLLGLSGGGAPVLPGEQFPCPASAGCSGPGDPGLILCPASSFLGSCRAAAGTVVIVGPPRLASLAPFVQSPGHILVTGASARARLQMASAGGAGCGLQALLSRISHRRVLGRCGCKAGGVS